MSLHSYKPMRRTPLNKTSDKTKANRPDRFKCMLAVRKRSGMQCEAQIEEADCTGRYDHVHEKLPRSAVGSTTDPANCLAVCFNCHRFIHEHPEFSYSRGFLISRYEGKDNG